MMGSDPLSPIAPARPRALLLPTGKITHASFMAFAERMKSVSVVRLGDVSPDARPNRTMFSPLAFPMGSMIYNLSIALPPHSHLALSPFELFREPLIVLGLADCSEHPGLAHGDGLDDAGLANDRTGAGRSKEQELDELLETLRDLQEQYSRALVHVVLLFDCSLPARALPQGIIPVPPRRLSRATTMKTVMCDVSSLFLAELTTYAKSLQALPSIDSPASSSFAQRGPNGHLSWDAHRLGHLSQHRASISGSASRSRSGSPSATNQNQQRMSMPAHALSPAAAAAGTADGVATILPANGTSTPLTASEDMTGAGKAPAGRPAANSSQKLSGGGPSTGTARDKVLVHGFGSGSLSERARNKGRGRVGLVVGTLFLLAGRWEDAVGELVESAVIAKANGDHLWHAKALETITVCLIMLAWAGLDFQVPGICYPTADKSSSLSLKPSNHANASNSKDADSASTVSHRLASLQDLANLLPDLLNLILALYNRASSNAGESLPQLAYSEFLIRYGKILAAAYHRAGRLDDDALEHFVLNRPLPPRLGLQPADDAFSPSKVWIATMTFRAMPPPSDDALAAVDRVTIYAGIASVLSSLGFQRKKAFIMRELVATLVPSLIQARKVGAAELGVHPAAGLTVLNAVGSDAVASGSFDLSENDKEGGVEELLALLCRAYGIFGSDFLAQDVRSRQPRSTPHASPKPEQRNPRLDDSSDATVARALRHAFCRSFGNQNLKLQVLRCCINVCEALPDFRGVLRFTSEMLRTAGSGIAPDAGSHEASATLSREEQIRLATNISRTIIAARKVGLPHVAADYWDEFLIRGVEHLEPDPLKRAFPHGKDELKASIDLAEKAEKTPFIFDPKRKAVENARTDRLLIAGEEVDFRVTLQNLFEFEIEIERLSLDTEGVDFACMEHTTIVGSYRKQTMVVTGVPRTAGQLKVTGCVVQISGCWPRRFPIFSEPWYRVHDNKLQGLRPDVTINQHHRSPSEASAASKLTNTAIGPKTSILELGVIDSLPLVEVEDTGLPQAAMMMLEGETKSLSVTLRNISGTTPVDTVLFSFEDSTLSPIRAHMRDKDTTPAQMHELELQFRRRAFRWTGGNVADFRIDPEHCATVDLEVLGKAGLTGGVLQFDYSHLGQAREDIEGRFYTRQLRVPLTVSVNASVELVWTDVLPFCSGAHQQGPLTASSPPGETALPPSPFGRLFRALREHNDGKSHSILVLDLRNSWRNPLQMTLQVASSAADDHHGSDGDVYTTSDTVSPGRTARFMLPFPRVLLLNSLAPIPILDPANRRQFVLNSERLSSKSERQSRREFWYRHEILKLLSGHWNEPISGRSGAIELRRIRLSHEMMDAIKLDEVDVRTVVESTNSGDGSRSVSQIGPAAYDIQTNSFVKLTTRISNRTQASVHATFRMQPSLRNQQSHSALDLAGRLLWNGLLQQPLPLLAPGATTEVALSVCVLCRGEYEFNASVEEIQLAQTKTAGAKVAPHAVGDDRPLEEKNRRTWHAQTPCTVSAQDEELGDGIN